MSAASSLKKWLHGVLICPSLYLNFDNISLSYTFIMTKKIAPQRKITLVKVCFVFCLDICKLGLLWLRLLILDYGSVTVIVIR